MLVVEKLPWADTQALTAGVEAALDELQPGLPDITFDTHVFRPSDFIELAIGNLTQALVLGLLLVVAIVLLFLFDWRAALISLSPFRCRWWRHCSCCTGGAPPSTR